MNRQLRVRDESQSFEALETNSYCVEDGGAISERRGGQEMPPHKPIEESQTRICTEPRQVAGNASPSPGTRAEAAEPVFPSCYNTSNVLSSCCAYTRTCTG